MERPFQAADIRIEYLKFKHVTSFDAPIQGLTKEYFNSTNNPYLLALYILRHKDFKAILSADFSSNEELQISEKERITSLKFSPCERMIGVTYGKKFSIIRSNCFENMNEVKDFRFFSLNNPDSISFFEWTKLDKKRMNDQNYVPNVLLINAYSNVFFFDIGRNVTRRFEDNSLFKATFSCLNENIIAISRVPKTSKFKLLVIDPRNPKYEFLCSMDIGPDAFPDFGNFYVCNVFQVEPTLTMIAGVDFEPGKKQMSAACPHVLYLIRGELEKPNLQIKKLRLFSSATYSDLYLESGLYLPSFKLIYIESRRMILIADSMIDRVCILFIDPNQNILLLRPNNSNVDDLKLPLIKDVESKTRGFVHFPLMHQLSTPKFPFVIALNSDGKFSFWEFEDIRENNERFLKNPVGFGDDGLDQDKKKVEEKPLITRSEGRPIEKYEANNHNQTKVSIFSNKEEEKKEIPQNHMESESREVKKYDDIRVFLSQNPEKSRINQTNPEKNINPLKPSHTLGLFANTDSQQQQNKTNTMTITRNLGQNMGNLAQNVGNSAQNVGNSAQNVGNSAQNVGNSKQNPINTGQIQMPSSQQSGQSSFPSFQQPSNISMSSFANIENMTRNSQNPSLVYNPHLYPSAHPLPNSFLNNSWTIPHTITFPQQPPLSNPNGNYMAFGYYPMFLPSEDPKPRPEVMRKKAMLDFEREKEFLSQIFEDCHLNIRSCTENLRLECRKISELKARKETSISGLSRIVKRAIGNLSLDEESLRLVHFDLKMYGLFSSRLLRSLREPANEAVFLEIVLDKVRERIVGSDLKTELLLGFLSEIREVQSKLPFFQARKPLAIAKKPQKTSVILEPLFPLQSSDLRSFRADLTIPSKTPAEMAPKPQQNHDISSVFEGLITRKMLKADELREKARVLSGKAAFRPEKPWKTEGKNIEESSFMKEESRLRVLERARSLTSKCILTEKTLAFHGAPLSSKPTALLEKRAAEFRGKPREKEGKMKVRSLRSLFPE